MADSSRGPQALSVQLLNPPQPRAISTGSDSEELVRLLEETPQDKLLERVAEKIHGGTTYKEILAALMLAGVRNIQPPTTNGMPGPSVGCCS